MKNSLNNYPKKTKIQLSGEFNDHRGKILNISNNFAIFCRFKNI